MRWIIGIVVVVVIAILGYQYFGGTRDVDVAGQVEESAEQAPQETEESAEATGQAAEEAVEGAGQEVEETAEEATTGAGRAVGEAQETAEQAAETTQDTAEETTTAAGQAAGEAQETAEQATETTQETAEQAGETAQQSAGQAADTAGPAAGDVAGATEEATDEMTEEVTTATESTAEQATGAVEESLTEAQTAALTVGDVNLGERLTNVLQDAEASLEGVTDAESAQAAVPALTEINTQLEDLSGPVGQLPEEAKKILADFLRDNVTELKTLADTATSQQGVGEVLNPVLEPIMAKLDSWAQQPA
jgi:hypothetical protein